MRKYVVSVIGIFIGLSMVIYFLPNNNSQKSSNYEFSYGELKNQNLKLYKTNEKNPVILYAHGGGWTAGDKSNVGNKPDYFNDLGYHFISMNYRLSPQATYKEQVEDVVIALKWVIDHADKYGFDTERISLVGHSAGAHLMMLAATDEHFLKSVGLSKQSIHSLISIEGPLDLTHFITDFSDFQKVFGKDKNEWEEASPSEYIIGNEQPPTLIIAHLDKVTDTFIRNSQNAGNDIELFSADKLSHSELTKLIGTKGNKEAERMTDKITHFLQKNN